MGATKNHGSSAAARTLITETSDPHGSRYQLWAEITPCQNPRNTVELKFSSTWSGAKNAEEPQVRGRYLLDATAMDNLRRLLGAQ